MQKNEDNNDIIEEENSNKNKDSNLVQWLTEYQGFLTLLLILVTAYYGYKNLELQKTIYSPRIIPTEYIPPKEIDNEYKSSLKVSNLGYVGGSYNYLIKSNTFYLSNNKNSNERTIQWSYYIGKDDTATHNFVINTAKSNLPFHANYTIILEDDENNQITNEKICYQHIKDFKYKKIECN